MFKVAKFQTRQRCYQIFNTANAATNLTFDFGNDCWRLWILLDMASAPLVVLGVFGYRPKHPLLSLTTSL